MLFATKDTNGNVYIDIAPEAMEIPWIKDIYINDKHPTKIFFSKVIKWVFHVYSKDHALSGLSISERKKNVIDIYFNGKMPRSGMDNIEHNPRVQRFIAGYNEITKSITERIVETLDETVMNEKLRIANLDMTHTIDVPVEYDFTVEVGELYEKNGDEYKKIPPRRFKGSTTKKIKTFNTTLLADTIKSSFKLIETYEDTKKKAIKERRELLKEFDGETWLERYFRMEKTNNK